MAYYNQLFSDQMETRAVRTELLTPGNPAPSLKEHNFFQDLSGIRIVGILLENLVDLVRKHHPYIYFDYARTEMLWALLDLRKSTGFFFSYRNLPRLGSDVFYRSDCNENFDFEFQIKLPRSYIFLKHVYFIKEIYNARRVYIAWCKHSSEFGRKFV